MSLATDDRLGLFEHLDELRKRLFVCIIAVTVGVLVGAIFNGFMFDILLYPLRAASGLPETATKITTFSPAEPFMVSLKVWVVGGIIMASPIIIWELWAFLAPAFTAREKRYFYPVVFSSTALFLGGCALAYFLVLPKGLGWLLTFSAGTSTSSCAPRTTSPSWRSSSSPSAWCSSCRWCSSCSPRWA